MDSLRKKQTNYYCTDADIQFAPEATTLARLQCRSTALGWLDACQQSCVLDGTFVHMCEMHFDRFD